MTRIRRWLSAFAFIVATFALLEGIARGLLGFGTPPIAEPDPEIEYVLKPGRYWRYGNLVEINSHGLRAPEITPVATLPRLLLIGDSVIYGNHFLDQSDTITIRMRELLPELEVMPVAVSSWGPVNQAAYLARHGGFGAREAIIFLSSHDLHDIPSHSRNLVPYRLWSPISALGDLTHSLLERFVLPPAVLDPGLPPEETARQSLEALDAMLGQMQATGITTRLVYHPTVSERLTGPSPARAVMREWARKAGIPFHDLHSAALDAAHYRDDIHANAAGSKAIAAVLSGLIRP